MNEPMQQAPLVGYDVTGRPVYGAWPVQQAVVAQQTTAAPLAPIVARPWGAYFALGCLGLAALVVVGFILVAVLIGLSIAVIVLAIGMVALVICLLILRDLWRTSRKR